MRRIVAWSSRSRGLALDAVSVVFVVVSLVVVRVQSVTMNTVDDMALRAIFMDAGCFRGGNCDELASVWTAPPMCCVEGASNGCVPADYRNVSVPLPKQVLCNNAGRVVKL